MVVFPNGGQPSWTYGPCHKVALPIPIHNQPFLHGDSTKMHAEKARPFLGVDYSGKYKNVKTQLLLGVSFRMYINALCFEQCRGNFRPRVSGPKD